GGHRAAAGTILVGPFDEALAKVTAAVDTAWGAGEHSAAAAG
ncbi:MAG: bifunctional oligoribonuclease/PAP phosphatase NrnA, partial [Planctomycetia bacterium]|nr:bifunctional oligoribonuclease/PAP phosphatase NrnA [Planctomycetia bacterium]